MNKNMGVFLQEIRKTKGLTQKELAEQVGVSDKTISKWENGNSEPDTSLLLSLCKALDITVNEFLSCERIPPEDYSMKAEENIMALIEENKRTKRSSIISGVIGIIAICTGLFLLAISNAGLSFPLGFYLDAPSLIVLILLEVGVVLVSGVRDKGKVLLCISKTMIPVGTLASLLSLVIALIYVSDINFPALPGALAVVVLPLIYALFVKILMEVLLERRESCTEN